MSQIDQKLMAENLRRDAGHIADIKSGASTAHNSLQMAKAEIERQRATLREIIDLASGHRLSIMSEPSLRHELSLILDEAQKALVPNRPPPWPIQRGRIVLTDEETD